VSSPINLFEIATDDRSERPVGYRSATVQVGPLIAASVLGASVYDLGRGESISPYHYEHGNEEWLLVLEGRPTLRHADGEDELEPWDVVCFPDGAEGAHKVTNNTDARVRVVMLSTKHKPAVFVYPDSGKLAVIPPGSLFRLADEVDYWDGEAESVSGIRGR
jgi:uncharacterized cupin superfamily protein